MTIIAAIATAAGQEAARQVINRLKEVLLQGRSCIIQVNNRTNEVLTRSSHGHSSGGWASGDVSGIPDPEVPANSASIFGSESSGFATGAIGHVVYSGNGFELRVGWSNPWAGSNEAEIAVSGSRRHHFSTEAIAGVGDQKAHSEYDFKPDDPNRPRWSDWGQFDGALEDGLAAASYEPGKLALFIRGTDNRPYWRRFDGNAWSDWEVLDGELSAGPAAASYEPGKLALFVRGTDGRPYWRQYQRP